MSSSSLDDFPLRWRRQHETAAPTSERPFRVAFASLATSYLHWPAPLPDDGVRSLWMEQRMSGSSDNSFLSRPPKLPPLLSLFLGAISIPLGLALQGGIGGGLLGGGIACLLMAVWDFSRLRFVAWRRVRVARAAADRPHNP